MMVLMVLQLLVPLLLCTATAFTGRSRQVKAAQIATVGLYVLLVHLAGLWLILPWWTVWIMWAALLLAVPLGWRRTANGRSGKILLWSGLTGWTVAAAGLAWLVVNVLVGRLPPPGPVIDLSSPLPPGRYLVASGGNHALINPHFETLHPKTARQASYRGQSHGVDIVGLTPGGRTSSRWRPMEPEAYAIFGTPVLAPCAGRVMFTRNDRPDMPVPVTDQKVMAGNHVLLRCRAADILLAHMRKGSVSVAAGDWVRTGQKLGDVGNSGSSDTPHLHIHAQRPSHPAAPLSGNPLPIRLSGNYPVRGDRW